MYFYDFYDICWLATLSHLNKTSAEQKLENWWQQRPLKSSMFVNLDPNAGTSTHLQICRLCRRSREVCKSWKLTFLTFHPVNKRLSTDFTRLHNTLQYGNIITLMTLFYITWIMYARNNIQPPHNTDDDVTGSAGWQKIKPLKLVKSETWPSFTPADKTWMFSELRVTRRRVL